MGTRKKKKKVPKKKLSKIQLETRIRRLETSLQKSELAWPERRKIENKLAPLKRELTHRISGMRNRRVTIVSSPMGGKPQ